jgi:serine/threonine protein kinase
MSLSFWLLGVITHRVEPLSEPSRPFLGQLLPLLPQWMQDVLGQVMDALDYLHQLGIIHR